MGLATSEHEAIQRDEQDPGYREWFHVPPAAAGAYPHVAYLAGNSLGLPPRATRDELLADVDAWSQLAVTGHVAGQRPWLPYHRLLTEPAARLVGALPSETVVMNSLTVNLHLLMVSFYRPSGSRFRIVIEDQAFPSDSYAVRSQAHFHGFDPDQAVVRLAPRAGEEILRTEDVVEFLDREGESVALVLLGAVNFLTGQLMDIPTITAAGQRVGAIVGWDLAHAAGNVPLQMHDWGVDFAAWCSYKYLNSGPGALSGVFIHERHVGRTDLPRFEGWWSTREQTRFEMAPVASPPRSAEAWQVSNPPIFSMGPVRTSLEIFDRVGMDRLRQRSLRLTRFLEQLLDEVGARIITPRQPEQRGAQLSVRVSADAEQLVARMRDEYGVVGDDRRPDVVRLTPVPLYSTYHDCWRAAAALAELGGVG